ncbi:MAG: hypothetical protein K2H60_14830 [Muribaculaceae bacterium]|nr:hypothetical protein [Muribaculaceae bacterium]
MKKLLTASIVALCSLGYIKAQPITAAEDSILMQLNKVDELGQWINDNLFSDMFDTKKPIPMMIFTDNSVLSYNPDSTLVSIFQPREIDKTDNGTLYYLTNEVNPNFMMMVMGAPYEQGAYEKPWYYTKPWIFCSTFNQAQKMVPEVKDERDWYTMVLHEASHVWQQRHPEFLYAISNFEQLYGGPEQVGNIHKQDSILYSALKLENDALIAALNANNTEDEQKAVANFIQFRADRKKQMIDNGYPEELVRFCDMQELAEGQARYIEYNLGKHLGIYEDNDPRWGDLDRSGWFYVTGFNLYNLLKKRDFNLQDAYTGDIHPFDYYLK